MKYYNFDIWIDKKQGDHYPTRSDSQMGQGEGELFLERASSEVSASLQKLSIGDTDDAFLKDFGSLLFARLFQGTIGNQFQKSLGQVYANDKTGLRVRLRISSPEMATIPWELLYDEERDCFLATSGESPLTRYIELPQPIRDLKPQLPIKILVVIPGGSGLDVKAEKKAVEESLQGLGNAVRLKFLEGQVTTGAINSALVLDQYHILHFIGHGAFYKNEGHLVLNSKDGKADLVSADEFGYFFMDYPSMKLVVLNSCQSAESSVIEPLTGVAQQLVKKGVPAVVAMQFPISDETAKLFANDFYQKLCLGYEPGRIDAAISHARKRIRQEFGESMGFATPVLFMRSSTGIIFDLEDQANNDCPPIDQLHRLDDVVSTHRKNIALLKEIQSDTALSEASSKKAAQDIREEQSALAQVKSKIWKLYRTVATSAAPKLIALILGMSAILFFASYTKFFNIIHIDDLVERVFIPQVDENMQKTFSRDVRVILTDDADNGGLGKIEDSPPVWKKWREYHAELIDALRQAGAKVVAFDLTFTNPTTVDADGRLATAINDAINQGTQVVLSKDIYEGYTEKDIIPALGEPLNGRWGNISVGVERAGVVRKYELGYHSVNESPQGPVVSIIPSLALQAIMQFDRKDSTPVASSLNDDESKIYLKAGDGKIVREIPIDKRRAALNLLFDLADDNDLERATFKYHEVYALRNDLDYLRRNFQNKIVLVGYRGEDVHSVLGGKPRYGIHIHANVISNILNKVYVRPISALSDFLVITLMAVLGVLLQTSFRSWLRPKIPLPIPNINRNVELPILFVIVILIYLLLAFIIYRQTRVAFDLSYHIVAFWMSYVIVGHIRKKLGLK